MDVSSRYAIMGHFLRSRRLRVSPESVGLTTGSRRRSEGLRREEVAQLANVSPTWYAYLEQGRRINPSAEVLDALATALVLTADERRYLHAVATGGPDTPEQHPDERTTRLIGELVVRTDILAYPVYAITAVGDLMCWNHHTTEWYGDLGGPHLRYPNLAWWMFTSADARERIVGWETAAREITTRLRYVAGTRPTGTSFDTMLADLHEVSEPFARWWGHHDVSDQSASRRSFEHPERGRATLRLLALRPSVSPATLVVFHVPD